MNASSRHRPVRTVLLMDNDADFLSTQAELLEAAGYHVLRASDIEQAERLLADGYVHVAVVDIRMEDDDDANDASGLLFAKRTAYHLIPKIIMTDYPDYQSVREAMGPVAEGLPPAVDFVAKADGLQAVIEAVGRAFETFVGINWELPIRFADPGRLSFAQLANSIEPGRDASSLEDRSLEIEDLFRRLFYAKAQITIGRMLWHRQARVCVIAFAHTQEGVTEQYAVVCGDAAHIQEELDNLRNRAPQSLKGTTLVDSAESTHFGALAYALGDADLERTQTLRTCYHVRKADQVGAALQHLLTVTLAPWHHGGRHVVEGKSPSEMYVGRLQWPSDLDSRDDWQRRMQDLAEESLCLGSTRLELTQAELAVYFPAGQSVAYANPVPWLFAPKLASSEPVVCVLSPGILNADNVLVDAGGRTWLTDLGQTGQAPLLWDLISLEAAVRFDLLESTDLQAVHEFERRLIEPDVLNDRLDLGDVEPGFRKALSVIRDIRKHAYSLGGVDTRLYYEGMLVVGLNTAYGYAPGLKYARQELSKFAHGLLSAAMISTQLQAQAERMSRAARSVENGVRIDEGKRLVYVDGRQVDLSPSEYELLLFLYQRSGVPCTHEEIVRSVFKQEPGSKEQEASRVNALLSRLRGKIESDPKHPRFLHNRRGIGHCLLVDGTDES